MNPQDEARRDALTDAFTKANIDARNLTVEVVDGALLINGTVPDDSARDKIQAIIASEKFGIAVQFDVGVAKVQPIDSSDGRGRSPVTGTSSDSAHESRHQLDRK
jgi:hypothetical protein